MQDRPASSMTEERPGDQHCTVPIYRWLHGHGTLVEGAMIAGVAGLTLLMNQLRVDAYVVMSLYFLPVTLTSILFGRSTGCRMALFCVTLAIALLTKGAHATSWTTVSVWGGVLAIHAVVIGALSSDQRTEMDRLREMHRADTLSDALTGVANRRAFDYEMNRRMAEWNRQRQPLSLLLLDIDHFKRLNDTYGHQAGDRVIHDVAQLLAVTCRETDLVARYGGEEFAVVMPHTSCSEAMKMAERVRCSVEAARFEVGGLSIKTSVSVGVGQLQRNEKVDGLIARVDTALYSSKQAGRNCSHVHDGHHCEPFGAQTIGGFSSCNHSERSSRPVSANLGHTDSITGLPNKCVFIDELRRRLSETRRYQGQMSLMLVQVDPMDESEGLQTEEVQTIVAEHIRYIVRDSDLVASFGEDLFAVMMPSTGKQAAFTPAVRLRRRVADCRNNVCQDLPTQLTVSIGLTEYVQEDTVATILERADFALDNGRTTGGNRISVYSTEDCGLIEVDEEVEVIDAVH